MEEAIAKTKNADLITLFSDLKAGSENHLAAFTGQTQNPQVTQNTTQASVQYGRNGYRSGRQ